MVTLTRAARRALRVKRGAHSSVPIIKAQRRNQWNGYGHILKSKNHFDECNTGDDNHSLMRAAVSACSAFRNMLSR